MAGLTIGKFAAAEGVGVETVRFYQRRGLLALPERRNSGFREYSDADRWRLAFIRRAATGFTLGEIGELLGLAEARSTRRTPAHCAASTGPGCWRRPPGDRRGRPELLTIGAVLLLRLSYEFSFVVDVHTYATYVITHRTH
jgi:DNA-binding transcriptional MerR regulator